MEIFLIVMIVLGMIILVVISSRWHANNYEYECKECKKRFSLTPFKDFSGVLAIDEKHVNCPFCKKKVWAKMIKKLKRLN